MRICCLNNYPLAKMRRLAEAGEVPAQHVWGVDALDESATEMALAPFHESYERSLLARLSRRTRYLFGQLDQQAYAVLRGPFDAIYSADGGSLRGIAMSRRLTARGARLVSVVHHPMRRIMAHTKALRAHDALLCLSERLRLEIIERHGVDHERVHTVPWGPDLAFPAYASTGEHKGIVSTGKANRDQAILVRALAATEASGVVYDLDNAVGAAPSWVELIPAGGQGIDRAAPGQYLYSSVIEQLRAASVVAIPIADPDRLTGLSELNDALALGKPIVITCSPYTPIDVDEIGCGIVVDAQDDAGWREAIATLAHDDDLRTAMGARARAFAEREWNYERFCSDLVRLVIRTVAP